MAALSLLLAASVACNGGTPKEGDELEVGALDWRMEPLPPQQSFVLLLGTIRKLDEGKVTITGLEPVKSVGFPEVARLVSLRLGPRGPDLPPVPQSAYITDPPATALRSGECAIQQLSSAEGFSLRHDTDPAVRALVATRVEAVAPGVATLDGVRVTYESDGQEYFQILPLRIEIPVSRKVNGYELTPLERKCSDDVEVLSLAP